MMIKLFDNLSLRMKTLFVLFIALAPAVIATYIISEAVLLKGFVELEERQTLENVARLNDALSGELLTLQRITSDWAAWDDTYTFIEDANDRYIETNLLTSTYTSLNLDLMIFLNSNGKIVYGQGFDQENMKYTSLSVGLSRYLKPGSALLKHESASSSVKALLLLPEGPLLVVSQPILPSDEEGPINGTLVFGRYLDAAEIKRLADLTHLSLALQVYGKQGSPDFNKAYSLLSVDKPVLVRSLNENLIAGYSLLRDIYGKPILIFRVLTPRDIYNQGKLSHKYFIVAIIITGFVLLFLSFLLSEKMILSRLTNLIQHVIKIGQTKNFSSRVPTTGGDELSTLAGEINTMLSGLEQSQEKIKESEEHFRGLFNEALTGNYISSPDGKILLCNSTFAEMLGFKAVEEALKTNLLLFFTNDEERQNFLKLLDERKKLELYETDLQSIDGKKITVLQNIIGKSDQNGCLTGIHGYIFDITERKAMEEQLKYLSLHDPLTGLYNRAYFEEEMRRLGSGRFSPVGIIICDVDGLKLINDSIGHNRGDALLIAAARVIGKAFRANDMIARIGGDEFAVLIPNGDITTVEKACQRMKEQIIIYNGTSPEFTLNISIGYAVSGDSVINMEELFAEADNSMYREKILHRQEVYGTVVQDMAKALKTKDFINDGHADRIQELVLRLAEAAGFPEKRYINDLNLFARYHDVGKIGIPEKILFKKDPLTTLETAAIRQHCDIGYRIAQSAPELMPIADWILKHHEWWNGKGYPLGLKGEEIPLECRIMVIVDAYEAMTHDRPYRKAMSRDDAVKELEKLAGSQFDPGLVQLFIQIIMKEEDL
ncbi:MAG: CHASE4 domain-containing protein [Eubacteriales bacterium]|jgi:diguanylate cyclase (GGDEF)-like protein/PAS domain S-box-containing protein